MSAAAQPVLLVEALNRSFGDRDVLSDVAITLAKGERMAVRGVNGSGKTTLLRCVTGALAPSTGSVAVCGYPAGSLAARRRTGAALSEARAFAPGLAGRDTLAFTARVRLDDRAEGVHEVASLIEELELEVVASRRVEDCSTGMLQQLAFARSLIGSPQLLVLDEPTRSLDDDAVRRLWAAVDRRPSLAVLIASHGAEDARRCTAVLDLSAA